MEKAVHDEYWGVVMHGKKRANECIKCGACEEACPQHIKIRDELEKAASDPNSTKIPTTKTTVSTNKDGTTTMTTTTGEDTSSTGKWSKYDDGNKPYLKKNQPSQAPPRLKNTLPN